MGVTFVDVELQRVEDASDSRTVRCLVDSGSTYTVVPAELLHELGVTPKSSVVFELADGSTVKRSTGWAFVRLNGHSGYTPIAFGEKGDSELLGVLTLENLGLWLDPLHRQLHPLKQTL